MTKNNECWKLVANCCETIWQRHQKLYTKKMFENCELTDNV